jgi:hypothetical protein
MVAGAGMDLHRCRCWSAPCLGTLRRVGDRGGRIGPRNNVEREGEKGEGERPYKWDPLPRVIHISENHLQT